MQPFVHNRHGPKIGGSVPFWGAEAGPHLKQCRLGRGLPTHQVASWFIEPQQIWDENWGGGRGFPSNTLWPGRPMPMSVPSFIWIRPTVWPQYTNVTDRTERLKGQDRQTTVR